MKCDELKVHKAYNRWIDEEMPTHNDDLICNEVYIKSEADKVIADLEESHKMEVEQLLMEIVGLKEKLKNSRNARKYWRKEYLIEYKECCSQKYKRCLDNAWGCQQRMELFHELALEEARTIALPNEVALKEYRLKRERAAKWHNRWIKIAEQFKEGV